MHDGPQRSTPTRSPHGSVRDGGPDGPRRARAAHVAAFVCPEIARVGREVGFPVAVIAATTDPDRYAARLSATRHAGWSPRDYDDWCMPFDDGLTLPADLAYVQLRFDARWLGPRLLPDGVTLDAGSLVVDLPPGSCAADLSAVLRAGLVDSAYDRVARRPDKVRHRHATRRPVVVAPRYSLLRPGNIERVVAVDDLFAFRPAGLADLARAVALAVDALVMGSAMAAASNREHVGGGLSHA